MKGLAETIADTIKSVVESSGGSFVGEVSFDATLRHRDTQDEFDVNVKHIFDGEEVTVIVETEDGKSIQSNHNISDLLKGDES